MNGEIRILTPKKGAISVRQRAEGSFEGLLEHAGIRDLRFHDLRHTLASWNTMNGGNLCELARILGHASIEKASRLATLGWQRMAKTGSLLGRDGAREWEQTEHRLRMLPYCSRSGNLDSLVAAKCFRMWVPETGLNRRRRPSQGVNNMCFQLLTRIRGLPKYGKIRVLRANRGWKKNGRSRAFSGAGIEASRLPFLRMHDVYDPGIVLGPGRGARMGQLLPRVIPVQRGRGARTLLIGIRGPVVGIERKVRVRSGVDTD